MTIQMGCKLGLTDTLDLPRALDAVKSAGFDGVELAGIADDGSISLLLRNANETRQALRDSGLAVSSIATHIALHHAAESAWQRAKLSITRAAEFATFFDAPLVRLLGHTVARRESRSVVISRAGAHFADACAALPSATSPLSLALQNGGSFINPRELWQILETAASPRAAIAWDVAESTLTAESPTLSVHTLNSRIHQVRIWDHLGSRAPVPLGTGNVHAKLFLEKLRGIGFSGWLVYAPPTPAGTTISFDENTVQLLSLWSGRTVPGVAPKAVIPASAKF